MSRFDCSCLVASSLIEKLLTAQKSFSETLVELNTFLLVFDEDISSSIRVHKNSGSQ